MTFTAVINLVTNLLLIVKSFSLIICPLFHDRLQRWNDSSLSWNTKEYPLITRITLPADVVWTPDVLIWNT